MKLFISKLLIFVFLPILAIALKANFIPYNLGNPEFSAKLRSFETEPLAFNTIAFGSSRIFRGLNPDQLDQLNDQKTRTYNFATGGTYNPEAYYLYRNALSNFEAGEIDFAFVELQELNPLSSYNAQTTKGSYWNTGTTLSYCRQYLAHLPNNNERRELTKNYETSFLFRLCDFNSLKYLIDHRKFLSGHNGYHPLDDVKVPGIIARREEFLSGETDYAARIAAAKNIAVLAESNSKPNPAHISYLHELIRLSKRKGIHVIFVIPPRLEDYDELIAVKNRLDAKHVIELASYDDYQELYEIENSYDVGHLNAAGAEIFTHHLSKQFLELIEH